MLDHIYDAVKDRSRTGKAMFMREADSSIGSGKRGPLIVHHAHNDRIRLRPQIDFFHPLQLRGRRARRLSSARVSFFILAAFRQKAAETNEFHTSNPDAGEGDCRRFLNIDTSRPDLSINEIPWRALTFLSVFFRRLGIYGADADTSPKFILVGRLQTNWVLRKLL